MRDCKKNQRDMYYALYNDKVPKYDKNGDFTFEYTTGYYNPVPFKGSLSSGKSEAEDSPFGSDVSYDRTITTCDMTLPVTATSLIWVKNEPTFKNGVVDGKSADYKVSAPPLDGLHSLRIAVKSLAV